MNLRRGLTIASAFTCVTLGAWAPRASPPARPDPPPERVKPAGEGVVCGWAIYTILQSVGSKCFPGKNPEFQASLGEIVGKYDAYMARNAKDFTPEQLAEFKRTQGHTATPAEHLCQGDAVEMYRAFEKANQTKMRSELDKVLAKDGPPTWGTCL